MEKTIKNETGEIISQSSILHDQLNFTGLVYDQFIHEINPLINTEDVISFHKCTFKSPVILERIKAKELSFIDCRFDKEFALLDSKISIIGFTECRFKIDLKLISNNSRGYCVFRKVNSPKVNISGNYQDLQFVSSNIKKINLSEINSDPSKKNSKIRFLINNNIDELKIEPFTIYSHILFKGSKYKHIHLEGIFYNRIVFQNKVRCKNLLFESSSFHYRIDFEEGNFDHVHLYRSTFNGLVYINDFDNDDIIDFSYDLSIDHLWLHSCTFDKDITVNLIKINHITISNNNFKQLFSFNNYKTLSEIDDDTDIIMISSDGTNRGTIIIERTHLDLSLGGINFGDLFIKDSIIWSIYLQDLDNKGSISLKDIQRGNFFTIHNSNSGNLNLINTDINNFKEIVIANSDINGLNTSSYPDNILSYSKDPRVGYGLSDKSKNRANLKNIYNQLKQIAKGKRDTHTAFKYQSLEHKNLLLSKRFGFDSILLSLNWISNSNGKSWSRGVLFTLIVAFLFYSIYITVLGYSLNLRDWWKDYILFISSFPKLTLEKYSVSNSTWSVSLVIWISRIFISYGIYQTIAAFRKYGK